MIYQKLLRDLPGEPEEYHEIIRQNTDENIWAEEGWSDGRVEKAA
jgi:hypothetical protein